MSSTADTSSASSPSVARRLRALIALPGPTVVVECLNPATARVVELAGVEATYLGGYAAGALNWALPDHGLVTLTEMAALTQRITDVVGLPLIVDADQGGETGVNVRRTVMAFERAGAAGVHLEDTLNPKKMSKDDALMPVAEMCARLAAAADARRDEDLVLIARTDELMNGGSVDRAIERGIAYAEAGADVFMCCDLTLDDVEQVARAVPIPLLDLNKPRADWGSTSLAVNLHTGGALMSAVNAHQRLVDAIVGDGFFDFAANCMPEGQYRAITREDAWEPVAQDWIAVTDRWSRSG